jgi:hypothetical protein
MNYFAAMLLMQFPCVYRPNDSKKKSLFQWLAGFTTFTVFMSANHKRHTVKFISKHCRTFFTSEKENEFLEAVQQPVK